MCDTVNELNLNHDNCSFSSDIYGYITAGQGKLGDYGDWEIPCPECASRVKCNEKGK